MNSHSKALVKIYLAFGQSWRLRYMLDNAGIDHSMIVFTNNHIYYEYYVVGIRLTDKFVEDYMNGKLP